MTVFESIMLFLTFVCIFICIAIIGKDIKKLNKLSANLDAINDRLRSIDDDSRSNGPIYGPMLEDEGE